MKRLWIVVHLMVGTALAGGTFGPIDFETDSVTGADFVPEPGKKTGLGPKTLDSLYYYNEIAYNSIGLTAGGLMHWAARFTIDAAHAGKLMEAGVFIYVNCSGGYSYPGFINVYSGTDTSPGSPIGVGDTFGPVTTDGWQVYDCSPEDIILTPGTELWVWVQQQHIQGQCPAACDHGPCLVNYGCWVSLDGTSWENLSDYGLSYNWNIYAIVDVTGVEEDVAQGGPYLRFSTLNCGQATIEYCIPRDADVSLKVYDAGGRLKMTLKDGPVQAGKYAALVSGLSPGIYTVSFRAGEDFLSEKMVVGR